MMLSGLLLWRAAFVLAESDCKGGSCDAKADGGRVLLQRKLKSGESQDGQQSVMAESISEIPEIFWGHAAKRADAFPVLLQFSTDSNEVIKNHGNQTTVAAPQDKITITPPSSQPYNLARVVDSGYYAQWRQDEILRPILDQIHDGFFLESGACDGEDDSNSLYYELHGWTGLLVEPSAAKFPQLAQKNRKAYLFNGCLSPTKNQEMLHFKDTADFLGHQDATSSFQVQAEPLSALMTTLNRKTIDFWSLDIEGSESAVLRNTDFDQIEVGVLLIEMNKNEANNQEISSVMRSHGFSDVGKTRYNDSDGKQWLDHIFVNPQYFKRRGIKYPKQLKWNDWSWSWDW